MSYTLTPARLYGPSAPTTSISTLYTVPSSTSVTIKQILLSNTSSASASITINLVPTSGTAQTSNEIIPNMVMMPNSIFTLDLSQVMNTNDTLQGLQSSSGAINVTISGTTLTIP